MRIASFPSLQGFLRRCVLLILVLTGAFASAQALTNGNFEAAYVPPTITGWLKSPFLSAALTGATPYNGTSIVRNPGGIDLTSVVTNAITESQPDSVLGRGQPCAGPSSARARSLSTITGPATMPTP